MNRLVENVTAAIVLRSGIPTDILDEFGVDSCGDSPAFSGHIDSHVAADRLEAMITALEARGYTIVRDWPAIPMAITPRMLAQSSTT